ncbi:MAG: hypothetical protein JSR36_17640 [Proteobacteria bacterium]|nr:hypothetical protein [Pseudomonadota bacterium]
MLFVVIGSVLRKLAAPEFCSAMERAYFDILGRTAVQALQLGNRRSGEA